MNAELTSYLGRQRQGIATEVAAMGQLPPIVAALDLSVLTEFWSRRPDAVLFTPLPGFPSGAVQRGPTANWLWYDPVPDDYRRAFQAFLSSIQKVKAALPSDIHVDHVYNRTRAKQFGYRLVRMALVAGPVNTDHGRGYEKGMGAADKGRRAKSMKLLDAMTELKVFGVRSLSADAEMNEEQLAAAASAASTYGISVEQAVGGITNMRDRARGRS